MATEERAIEEVGGEFVEENSMLVSFSVTTTGYDPERVQGERGWNLKSLQFMVNVLKDLITNAHGLITV